jgi:conserved transporter
MPAWIPDKRKGKLVRLKVCMGIPFYVVKGAEQSPKVEINKWRFKG